MKKALKSPLRSLLIEAASIRHLPITVIRQLVGYYGDWRRSRDIIPDIVEATNGARAQRLFTRSSRPSSSNSFRRP